MSLDPNINTLEKAKFLEKPDGSVAVRTDGTSQVTGLRTAGKVTEVVINDTTWTALPATPLANRNAVSIQNFSGQLIKLNYDNTVSGFVGAYIPDQVDRFYDIQPTITQYAKCASGTATIVVEELS